MEVYSWLTLPRRYLLPSDPQQLDQPFPQGTTQLGPSSASAPGLGTPQPQAGRRPRCHQSSWGLPRASQPSEGLALHQPGLEELLSDTQRSPPPSLAFKAFPALPVLQKDARSPWGTLGATWMGTSLNQTLRKHKSTSFCPQAGN